MAKESDGHTKAAEPAAEGAGKKKRSNRKWFIMGFLLVILLAGGALGGKYYLDQQAVKKVAAQQKAASAGILWAMDTFIVNLMDNGGERYLKVAMQLELSDPEVVPELKEIKPKLRDAVLGILASKSLKDVSTAEGKQRLKEEISNRLSSYLSKGKIYQIYFTEFVIQ